MSALGFLGGLAGAYTAIDRGMQVAKERERADEDRAYLQEQRGLLRQQQQREREAQERAETLRKDLAAIPTTETYKVDLNPEALTNYEDGTSIAPAMVDRTRQRTTDSQLRDASAAFRKSGDLGRALELNAAADKEMFGRAARSFAQLRAGAGNMTAAQIARQAKSIFDSDPFPMEVAAIREGQGGAISVDIRNRDTGQTATWNAKNKEELLSGIEAYYSPDNFAALDQARRKAAIDLQAKRDEELFKPRILKPGEALNVFDPRTERYIQVARGNIPAGFEVAEDSSGNPVLRRMAAGRADASPDADLDRKIGDEMKRLAEVSQVSQTTQGDQAARWRELSSQFARQLGGDGRPVPVSSAVAAALEAATKPDQVRPTFDERTGHIVTAIRHRGGNFVVDDLGGVASQRDVKPEVMQSIAGEYVSNKVPKETRPLIIAAAFNGQARTELEKRLAAAAVTPEKIAEFTKLNGRAPTEEEKARSIRSAQERFGPVLDLIRGHLDRGAIKGGLEGSGFALVDGKVVPAPAPGAASPGRAALAAAAGPALIPSAAALEERAAQEARQREDRLVAERAAAQRTSAERAQTQRTLSDEVRAFAPGQLRAMRPGEVQSFLEKYGSVITLAQANAIYHRHWQSLTDQQKRQLRRRM